MEMTKTKRLLSKCKAFKSKVFAARRLKLPAVTLTMMKQARAEVEICEDEGDSECVPGASHA
jgi:hypothetical protein